MSSTPVGDVGERPPLPLLHRLARLGANSIKAPIGLLTYLDRSSTPGPWAWRGNHWVKHCHGTQLDPDFDLSFLAGTILANRVVVVQDAAQEAWFPEVSLRGSPIRFFAGAPLGSGKLRRLGALCVLDTQPHPALTHAEQDTLAGLAEIAGDDPSIAADPPQPEPAAQSDGLMATICDSAATGISVTNEAGEFVKVNQAYCRLVGYSAEELIGHCFTMILPCAIREKALRLHRQFLYELPEGTFEAVFQRKDGQLIQVQATAKRMPSSDGSCFRISTIMDVGERKRLQERLQRAQKWEAIGMLAAAASSDLDNCLTVISGNGDLLLSRLSTADPATRCVREICRAAARGRFLAQQLAAVSRPRAAEPGEVEINQVVGDLERMLGEFVNENVELMVVLDPNAGSVCADPQELKQALINFALTAHAAMPEGGRLTIQTAKKSHDRIAITIGDTGGGMDTGTAQRMLDPFFVGAMPGPGVGLAMAHEILQLLGAEVRIDSEPGIGTLFRVVVPSARRDRRKPAARVAPPEPPAALSA